MLKQELQVLLRPVLLEHNEQGRAWEEMKSESDPRARILSVTRDTYREQHNLIYVLGGCRWLLCGEWIQGQKGKKKELGGYCCR